MDTTASVLLVLLCAGVAWASEAPTRLTIATTTSTTTPATSSTLPSPSPSEPPTAATDLFSTSPDPEELVSRIRALVRALKDADQLLKALRIFRDSQGDETVLRIMKNEANRTLAEQVREAMEKLPMNMTVMDPASAISLVTPATASKLSSKVPFVVLGKKSAKYIADASLSANKTGLFGNPTAIVPIKKSPYIKSNSTTQNSTTKKPAAFSVKALPHSLQKYEHTGNGTVITRVKTDPILGTYKVVIRDLTPAASGNLKSGQRGFKGGGGGRETSRRNDMFLVIPPQWLVPPFEGTPPPAVRGRVKYQDSLPTPPCTTAATTSPLPLPTTSLQQKTGKVGTAPKSKARHVAAVIKKKPTATTTSTTTTSTTSTTSTTTTTSSTTTTLPPTTTTEATTTDANVLTTTTKPVMLKKSFQKRQKVKVSATLRTAPVDREEDAAALLTPLETPIISNIFPKYGPAAEIQHIEKPFVPFGNPGRPSEILLPPVMDKEDGDGREGRASSLGDTKEGGGVRGNELKDNKDVEYVKNFTNTKDKEIVHVEKIAAVQIEVPDTFFLGESPWIPIIPPPDTKRTEESRTTLYRADPTTSPYFEGRFLDLKRTRPVKGLPSKHLVTSTKMPTPLNPSESDLVGRGFAKPRDDFSRWQPSQSKIWQQFSSLHDRQDDNLHDATLQDLPLSDLHLQLQLQPEMPLSVAETMYYRLRPLDFEGSYGSIPGVPGRDYPVFNRPPLTSFTCASFGRKGYFADPASGCQAFYVCHGDGRGEAMLCPNGTIFSQDVLVCDWWYNVECK